MVTSVQPGGSDRVVAGPAPVCELRDLRTVIDVRSGSVRAVDGVSLSIGAGETVGLVGESGSGKTMTGMSIVRLLPPSGRIAGGSVLFGGRDLVTAGADELRRVRGGEIGVIFQDPMSSLDPTMVIGRQVAETWRLHRGGSYRAALAEATEMLGRVGLPNPSDRIASYPHQLSGGLRQRVMIAMALVCRPNLLIADEPTTALDVTIQAQILELLSELQQEMGMAVLLITHDMGVVANHTDRVAVMYAGEIVEEAGAVELFASTRHRYSQALLDSIPRLSQDRTRRLHAIGGLPPDLSAELTGCRFAPRCRHATDECRAAEPEPVDEGGHLYACFHPSVARTEMTAVAVGGASVAAVAAEPAVLVSCEAVTKEFPIGSALVPGRHPMVVHAVTEVSLDLREGETFGLVGESGCGKTTLGHMIVGLEEPTSGRIVYGGEDLASVGRGTRRTLQRDLQLMFQDPYSSLDPRMKVGAIVAEPLLAQRQGGRKQRRDRVLELLEQVGLPAAAVDRYPHEFSGGQRQRIGLARALALHPRLIVADEPVSALDVSIRSQILNLMRELQEAQRLTYLVISHDLSVVRYLADRIGVMYLGRMVEIGAGADIYERPAHPYTAALLDSIPDIDTHNRSETTPVVRGELPSAIAPPSGCRYRTRCPLAQEVCAAEEPPLATVAGEHRVACHFPLQLPSPLAVPAGERSH